jgi:hypothetical protein
MPAYKAVPITVRTTGPALSTPSDRPPYGAARESMKPNRPTETLSSNPPMMAIMNPAAAATMSK